PGTALTGSTSPRRSVCAPDDGPFPVRRPQQRSWTMFRFSVFGWLKSGQQQCREPRQHRRKRALPRQRTVLQLEALEDRAVPSTFTVTNLSDHDPGSLRAAILAANANPGADTIQFAHGLHGTIPLASEVAITQDLTIHGPGANQVTVSGGGTTRVFDISG